MSAAAVFLAALLTGQPPVATPTDPMWIACEEGEATTRIESCGEIANNIDFELPLRSWALVLRASAQFDAGELQSAIRDLDRAIRMQPEEWIAYRFRGEVLLAQGLLDEALADFDMAIEIAGFDAFNYLSRAYLYRQQGDYGRALRDIQEAIILDPGIPELYFERGQISLFTGDYDQAVLDFRKYLDSFPEESAAHFNIAKAYQAQELYAEALPHIEAYVLAVPSDPDGYQLRAWSLVHLDQAEAALIEIDKAAELAPGRSDIHYDRAYISRVDEDCEAAVASYSLALPAYENDPAIFVALAECLWILGESDLALENADRAIRVAPEEFAGHWLKIVALLDLGRTEEALTAADAGLAAVGEDVDLLIGKARAEIALGNNFGAMADLTRALEIDPTSVEAEIWRAAALGWTGFRESAREILEGILAEEPDNGVALEQLAILLQSGGHFEEALAAYERLADLFPEEPNYPWGQGVNHTGLGNYPAADEAFAIAAELFDGEFPSEFLHDQGYLLLEWERPGDAIPFLEAALEANPDDAVINGNLGLAFHRIDDQEAAITYLRRALRLFGNHVDGDFYRLHLARTYLNADANYLALYEYDWLAARYEDVEVFIFRGWALAKLGRHEDALTQADEALRLDPRSFEALLLKAGALAEMGKAEDALPLIQKVIVLAPDDPRAYVFRVRFYDLHGEHELALVNVERLLEIEPDNADYLNSRADLLVRLHRFEEAHVAALETTRQYPDYSHGWITLGEALQGLGRHESAMAAFDRAIELEGFAEAYLLRAQVHFRLGQEAEALNDLGEADERDESGRLADRISDLRSQIF